MQANEPASVVELDGISQLPKRLDLPFTEVPVINPEVLSITQLTTIKPEITLLSDTPWIRVNDDCFVAMHLKVSPDLVSEFENRTQLRH